jgi:hypothetical protein
MADSLISKPFSEGAPLDPNALNDLRADLVNTYAKANVLYNSTESGQTKSYKYIFNCGTESFEDLEVNTPKSIPLDLGTGFDASPAPKVVATIRTSLKKGETVSTYVTSSNGGNWQLWVTSNVKKKINVDWIAIQKLPA